MRLREEALGVVNTVKYRGITNPLVLRGFEHDTLRLETMSSEPFLWEGVLPA